MESKPIVMMTAEEFQSVIREVARDLAEEIVEAIEALPTARKDAPEEWDKKTIPPYVIGYAGLGELLGVSEKTAKRRVDTGAFEGAIKKQGGVLVVNAPLALRKWSDYTKKRKGRG